MLSEKTPWRACSMSRSLMSVAKILRASLRPACSSAFSATRATLYGSSPVEQPGTQMRIGSPSLLAPTMAGNTDVRRASNASGSRKNSVTMMRMSW